MPLRRSLALALVLLPLAARADRVVPPPGVGLVGVGVGVRYVPQSAIVTEASKNGHDLAARSGFGPAALLPFSYRVDKDWSVGIELGWGTDELPFVDGSKIAVQTIPLQIKGERSVDFGLPGLELYGALGTGYYLSTAVVTSPESKRKSAEAHAAGGFLAIGARIALTADVGLVPELRYAFAVTGVEGYGALTVGGATATLGLYYAWRE